METEIHRAENLEGAMHFEKPSEDGVPREKGGIEPFKSLLEFLRAHPSRDKCDMLHIIEIPLIRQYPPRLL
jgi:hypothetical protein